MERSSNMWKILEWDKNSKQTNLNNSGQGNTCIRVCISYSVHSNAHTTQSVVNPTRLYSAQSMVFLEYHPLSNITRCQVPSRVRAWFQDSAGDIDCYYIFVIKIQGFCIPDMNTCTCPLSHPLITPPLSHPFITPSFGTPLYFSCGLPRGFSTCGNRG